MIFMAVHDRGVLKSIVYSVRCVCIDAMEIHCRTLPVGSHFTPLPAVGPPPSPSRSPLCFFCSSCFPHSPVETLEHSLLLCPALHPTLAWEDRLWSSILGQQTRIPPFQRLLGLQPDHPHPSASSPFWPHFYGALRSACWSFRCSGRYGSSHLPPPFPTWSSARRLRWLQARLLRLAQASIRRTLHFLIHDSICRNPLPSDADAPGDDIHALPPAHLPPIFHTLGLSPPGVPQPPFPSFIDHLSMHLPGIASLLVPSTAPRPLPGVHTPHVYSFSPHVFSP